MIPRIPTVAGTSLEPFAGQTAPDQASANLSGSARTAAGPEIIADRPAVAPLVGRLPGRTLSAGDETTPVPQTFDLPSPLRRIFSRIRSGNRTTLLAPELQSELDQAGKAEVMPARGMNAPYVVADPGPWYESYLRTIGR